MQKDFNKLKGVCHVIINDLATLIMKVTYSSNNDSDLKNKYISTLQDRINKINDHVKCITDFYNNRKSDFGAIVKNGHFETYLNGQRHSVGMIKKVIDKRFLDTNKDVVISDNDDAPVKARGIDRYYSKDLAQSIIDEYPSLHFGNKQFLPDLIVGQHKSDRKLNNNGMSGAYASHLVGRSPHTSLTSHAREFFQPQTKSKDTVIDVDKIGRGLTTPMIAFEDFNSLLYKANTIRKHYYAKSKPMVPSEVVVENLPTNDGKANTKDIVL